MLTKFARKLREDSTNAERLVWHHLRAGQIEGLKFRRQQPIGHYIVDFVCFSNKLVIELDGSQHSERENKEADKKRDEWLRGQGFTVLRFWDNEVLQNIEGVGQRIYNYCHPPLSPLPSREGRKDKRGK